MAEFIGTFGFVYAILASMNGSFGSLSTPAVAALTLAVAVMTIGLVSGAHVNPAVTIGAWSVKKIDKPNALAYILAQFSGALAAWVVISLFFSDDIAQFATADNTMPVFWAEFIGTAFFGFGIAAAMHNGYKGITAAAVVGLSLFIGSGWAAIASNGILNPAVAAATGSFNFAYVLGPAFGSVLGMQLYRAALTAKGKL